MAENDIVITGLGMSSPVGGDAVRTCASVRAGICRFRECENYFCEPEELDWGEPEPMIGSRAPHLGLEPVETRIRTLILDAVQDLVHSAGMSREIFSRTVTAVALPPADRTGAGSAAASDGLAAFFPKSIGAGGPEGPRIFTSGSTGFFDALGVTVPMLRNGGCGACIIIGADSYHDERVLALLDKTGRLKSRRNKDGFIPGEAAAAVLLETRAAAVRRGADILAMLGGFGSGKEPVAADSGMPGSGKGLADAVRLAIGEGKEAGAIEWVACDLNGMSGRAYEWGLCRVMLSGSFKGLKHVWHPADCLGDVGAASGAVLVSLAGRAFRKGYAPAGRCLIFCAADNGDRAALVLQADKA